MDGDGYGYGYGDGGVVLERCFFLILNLAPARNKQY
jgi:hypothetical protein